MAPSNSTSIEVPSRFRDLQHTFWMRGLIKGFVGAAGFLPVWFMRFFAVFLVLPLAVPLTWKNFQGLIRNLRRIIPDSSPLQRFLEAWLTYQNYAYYLIDLLYVSHNRERVREYTITVRGTENLWKAIAENRGAVLLTSHLGNWEIGGLALEGLGKQIHVVYSPDSSQIFERQRSRLRGEEAIKGIELKPGNLTSITLYHLLRSGQLVAIQGDRLLFDRGFLTPFFKTPARFPQGPIRLAQITGSPLVPIFIPRRGYKAYEIIIEPPLELNPQARIDENATRIIPIFERRIREYRTQWYTFRPFWEEDQ